MKIILSRLEIGIREAVHEIERQGLARFNIWQFETTSFTWHLLPRSMHF
jgi:hypothetical protein